MLLCLHAQRSLLYWNKNPFSRDYTARHTKGKIIRDLELDNIKACRIRTHIFHFCVGSSLRFWKLPISSKRSLIIQFIWWRYLRLKGCRLLLGVVRYSALFRKTSRYSLIIVKVLSLFQLSIDLIYNKNNDVMYNYMNCQCIWWNISVDFE